MAAKNAPLLFLALSFLLFLSAQAQSTANTSCANNLVPCASYLNSTSPPASCCTPLKDAITNQLDCLCAIYADPAILKAFNINVTAAQQLAVHCGIDSASTNLCSKAGSPSGTPIPPPPSKGAGSRPVWIGVSGLIGLFSIFWSICV